jgi:hypothetical protein
MRARNEIGPQDEWGDIEIEDEALANNLGKFGPWTGREQVPDLGGDE